MKIRAVLLCAAVLAAGFLFPMAPANADSLPNGYSVTCTPNGDQAICNISGCPRVHADEAGDVVHISINGVDKGEYSKGCNNTTTYTVDRNSGGVDPPKGFKFAVQGCRKNRASSDDCGAWSDYHYAPPAPAAQPGQANGQLPVRCTGAGPESGKTLPPGSTCPAAAPAAPPAPTKCPAGSLFDTAPAGQHCLPPSNFVQLSINQNGFNARVRIENGATLPAKCDYTATKVKGVGPQEVDRSIDVGPRATGTISDMLWPPPGTTYNASVKCTATWDGKPTVVGTAGAPVNG